MSKQYCGTEEKSRLFDIWWKRTVVLSWVLHWSGEDLVICQRKKSFCVNLNAGPGPGLRSSPVPVVGIMNETGCAACAAYVWMLIALIAMFHCGPNPVKLSEVVQNTKLPTINNVRRSCVLLVKICNVQCSHSVV